LWGTNAADDPLGNLLSMSVSKCSGPSLSVSVNMSNRITNTGFSYDAAGNNTADGSYTYTYDAENRITSAAGVNYSYDGNGFRVKKSSGTLYWRSISGDTIAESDLTGSTTNSNYHEYIFFAGRRVARSDPSSASVYYYFVDQLGSTRSVTQANGTVCFSADYYPYGKELDYITTCPQNYKFTGNERDSETGLDYAFVRYYNPSLGRFTSADPLAGSVADSQSLNHYAYVRNDPGNLIDPTGLYWVCAHGELYWAVDYSTIGIYQGTDLYFVGPCDDKPVRSRGGDLGGGGDRGDGGGGISIPSSPTWAFLKTLFSKPKLSTGPGSCIQVALDAAKDPLQAVHEVVHPLEENLAPLASMVQSPMPPTTTAIAAELWSMTTGLAGRGGPVADDFRDIVRQAVSFWRVLRRQ
jgi:RHS repeat-associated protein